MLFRGYCVWGSINTSSWEAISFQNSFPDPSVARSYQMLISSGGSERPTTNAARAAAAVATAQKVAVALFSRAKATGLLIHIAVQLMDT